MISVKECVRIQHVWWIGDPPYFGGALYIYVWLFLTVAILQNTLRFVSSDRVAPHRINYLEPGTQ